MTKFIEVTDGYEEINVKHKHLLNIDSIFSIDKNNHTGKAEIYLKNNEHLTSFETYEQVKEMINA